MNASISRRHLVIGAQYAADNSSKSHPDINVELVSADLRLKPDVAFGISGDWLDHQGVDLITDVTLSSAALTTADIVNARVAIFPGCVSADIAGPPMQQGRLLCGPAVEVGFLKIARFKAPPGSGLSTKCHGSCCCSATV